MYTALTFVSFHPCAWNLLSLAFRGKAWKSAVMVLGCVSQDTAQCCSRRASGGTQLLQRAQGIPLGCSFGTCSLEGSSQHLPGETLDHMTDGDFGSLPVTALLLPTDTFSDNSVSLAPKQRGCNSTPRGGEAMADHSAEMTCPPVADTCLVRLG